MPYNALSTALISHCCSLLSCSRPDDYHSDRLPQLPPAVYIWRNPTLLHSQTVDCNVFYSRPSPFQLSPVHKTILYDPSEQFHPGQHHGSAHSIFSQSSMHRNTSCWNIRHYVPGLLFPCSPQPQIPLLLIQNLHTLRFFFPATDLNP